MENKSELDRMLLEIENLLEITESEEEFNLNTINDLSSLLRKISSKISNSCTCLYLTKSRLEKMKTLSEQFFNRSVKIKEYINYELINRLTNIETDNLKDEIKRVRILENLIDVINFLDESIFSEEQIELKIKEQTDRLQKRSKNWKGEI